MSSEISPVPPTELTDTDLEQVTAGKELIRGDLEVFDPRQWKGFFDPSTWMKGQESVQYLQDHNMLYS
jgi:hypothetical protein